MSRRIERVNNLIRQELAELLRRYVKDPRLGNFVTVTAVSTSADFKHARIYVSHLDSPEQKAEILNGLAAATGFLRKELARRLKLRRMPEISFHWDDSIERGDHLLTLIDEVVSENPPES